MKPQKIFLLVLSLLLTLQLVLAACAPAPAPAGSAPAASSGDAAAAAAKPAEDMPPPDDAGIILDQLMVSGDREQIDKVVADFPLQAVGEPTDLGFLTENWEMRLYEITDGARSDELAAEINETATSMGVDVHAEPNVEVGVPTKPGAGVHGSPRGQPLPGPETGPIEQWVWGKQGVNLGTPPVKGENVTVGVFDTCPPVNVKPDWVDVIERLADPSSTNQDYLEHGTSIASLIDDMAPSAQIELYCVLAPNGAGGLNGLIQGIALFFIKHPNDLGIINLSLQVTSKSTVLNLLLDAAHKRQLVTVAAAGNGSTANTVRGMNYPASHSKVIGVAGSDYKRNRAEFSNQGKVAAPAGQQSYTEEETLPPCTSDSEIYIITRASKAGYLCWQGTSFATAFVSGEAALILSKYLGFSAAEVFKHIYNTADPGAPALGKGIINVTNALQ